MKVVKRILIVIAILIATPFIIALFVNGSYHIEREITINKPKQEVFDYIKLLKNQDNYSKWASMDPEMTKTYTGIDGTVGFISAWNSKKEDVGIGEQEILKVVEGERIDFELRFIEPFQQTDLAYMTTKSITENQTEVAWGFEGKMNYLMNLMMLFMDLQGMLEKDLDTGLENLKIVMEE